MTVDGKNNATLQRVDAEQLHNLTGQAAASIRKRAHLLLHSGPEDSVQRLIISAQPGTYVRPHRHSRQWEMLILQHGCMDILTFDRNGDVQTRIALDKSAPVVQIPNSTWHTSVVNDPDTIVVEVKPGPYEPNEFVDWAPEEGHADANDFLRWVTAARSGERWQRR